MRINAYHLLSYFLDRTATEDYICKSYGLTAEQVAAARAYVLNNYATVMDQHIRIEERIAAGNPPEVDKKMEESHAKLLKYKEWLEKRKIAEAEENAGLAREAKDPRFADLPTFKELVTGQKSWPE